MSTVVECQIYFGAELIGLIIELTVALLEKNEEKY